MKRYILVLFAMVFMIAMFSGCSSNQGEFHQGFVAIEVETNPSFAKICIDGSFSGKAYTEKYSFDGEIFLDDGKFCVGESPVTIYFHVTSKDQEKEMMLPSITAKWGSGAEATVSSRKISLDGKRKILRMPRPKDHSDLQLDVDAANGRGLKIQKDKSAEVQKCTKHWRSCWHENHRVD